MWWPAVTSSFNFFKSFFWQSAPKNSHALIALCYWPTNYDSLSRIFPRLQVFPSHSCFFEVDDRLNEYSLKTVQRDTISIPIYVQCYNMCWTTVFSQEFTLVTVQLACNAHTTYTPLSQAALLPLFYCFSLSVMKERRLFITGEVQYYGFGKSDGWGHWLIVVCLEYGSDMSYHMSAQ